MTKNEVLQELKRKQVLAAGRGDLSMSCAYGIARSIVDKLDDQKEIKELERENKRLNQGLNNLITDFHE